MVMVIGKFGTGALLGWYLAISRHVGWYRELEFKVIAFANGLLRPGCLQVLTDLFTKRPILLLSARSFH